MLFSFNFSWFCTVWWSQISIRTKSIAEIWENAPGRVYFTCGLCRCISKGKLIYWIIPWVNGVENMPIAPMVRKEVNFRNVGKTRIIPPWTFKLRFKNLWASESLCKVSCLSSTMRKLRSRMCLLLVKMALMPSCVWQCHLLVDRRISISPCSRTTTYGHIILSAASLDHRSQIGPGWVNTGLGVQEAIAGSEGRSWDVVATNAKQILNHRTTK